MSKRKNSGRSRGHREDKRKKALTVLEGKVQMTREGYAFVVSPDYQDDIFVKATKTCGALNGDVVKVTVTKAKTDRQRCEGHITEIVRRSVMPFVGILHIVGEQAWVLMQSKNMPYDIAVPMGEGGKGHLMVSGPGEYTVAGVVDEDGTPLVAKPGMKVAAVVDYWKRNQPIPTGHITDVLGDPGENDTEMHAILSQFNLPYRFEPEVVKAADEISEDITPEEIRRRRDFRDTLTFTIDPADAKDFDDALSLRKLEDGNYEVGVHIADVTHYVKVGSIVDNEAKERATSVYLVDRTVPMLPEKLCNKLCSLRPHEEKLTYSVVFVLSPNAKIIKRWIGRTVINSDYRFDYDGAQAIIKNDTEKIPSDVTEEIIEAVHILDSLAAKIRKKRFAAGAISFDGPETKVIVDEKGRPIDIIHKESFEANWLIEEFMLLANKAVAEFAGKEEKKTFVYRVHDEPNMEKLENLRSFAKNFGYELGSTGNGKEISKSLNALFEASKGTAESAAFELLGKRTMAKAVYDVENIGHYGLAFSHYTHFTSPIRRYPDMMVHRLLTKYLDKGESASKEAYASLCKHCSEREQVAVDAERASIKYKLVEYMSDKVGWEFTGKVSGITEWGMYVEIDPTGIEGMVPLRDIRSDYFEFDPEKYVLRGRHSRVTYTLGSVVKVKVKRASLEQVLLDYELIEEEQPRPTEQEARQSSAKAAAPKTKTKAVAPKAKAKAAPKAK
ncbi:MAG: ribonuclease R, partial [Bacteroidales bacterium]|nr:ribonuclease R [Bacteroidales bacterium]